MKEILLLINPFSGSRSLEQVEDALSQMGGSPEGFTVHTHVIRDFEDSRKATLRAVEKRFYAVVAVGGDGTANTTGALLKNTDTALGIVPCGSGNGVARHIGMDLDIRQSLSRIFTCRLVAADTLEVNGRFCLGFAGLGFEAAVAHNFAQSKHRGLMSYTTAALSEIFRYVPPSVTVEADGRTMERTPFTMTFANTSQWGFDFRIAPSASMVSGTMKMVILTDINQVNAVQAAYSLYKGKIDKFPSCETFDARHVVVQGRDMVFHIDGEPLAKTDRVEAVLHPGSLKLLSPHRRI